MQDISSHPIAMSMLCTRMLAMLITAITIVISLTKFHPNLAVELAGEEDIRCARMIAQVVEEDVVEETTTGNRFVNSRDLNEDKIVQIYILYN